MNAEKCLNLPCFMFYVFVGITDPSYSKAMFKFFLQYFFDEGGLILFNLVNTLNFSMNSLLNSSLRLTPF